MGIQSYILIRGLKNERFYFFEDNIKYCFKIFIYFFFNFMILIINDNIYLFKYIEFMIYKYFFQINRMSYEF